MAAASSDIVKTAAAAAVLATAELLFPCVTE